MSEAQAIEHLDRVHLRMSNGVAFVDAADYWRIQDAAPWYVDHTARLSYVKRHIRRADGRRATQYLHSFLTGWQQVDHINGDGLDDRRANLRPATHAQNQANSRLRSDNTSGFKGVSWAKQSNRWQVGIRADGRRKFLGLFDSLQDAALAYDAAAVELFGEFARLNFPKAESR